MEFRELTVADLPELMKLENELFPGEAWKEDSFRSELEGTFTDYFGAFDDGLVGYAGLSSVPASFSSDIQTLAVTSSRQGKGLGRLLVNKLVSKALALGSEAVFLEVRVDNNAAVSLYSSLGFEQIDVRKTTISPPGWMPW